VSFCVARVSHVYDLCVKHHVAGLLEVSALLRMQLLVQPLLASAPTFTADEHTIIYFFLHLFAILLLLEDSDRHHLQCA